MPKLNLTQNNSLITENEDLKLLYPIPKARVSIRKPYNLILYGSSKSVSVPFFLISAVNMNKLVRVESSFLQFVVFPFTLLLPTFLFKSPILK